MIRYRWGTGEQVITECLWHDAADATEIGCVQNDTIPCGRCPVCQWVRSRCRCGPAGPLRYNDCR
jgi:hypothetical protein